MSTHIAQAGAELFRRLFEGLPVGALALESGTDEVVAANAIFLELVGRPESDVVGHRPPFDWLVAPDVDALLGETATWTALVHTPDGTRRPVEVVGAVVDGMQVLIVRGAAEGPVIDRWRNAAVGQLAAGVAHEINNPLFAMLGTVEFLLEDAQPGSDRYERLERIQRAGRDIGETLRTLLDFAREPAEDVRVVSLADVCRDALKLVRRTSLAKGVEIEESYPDEPLDVEASPNQLKQILLALIRNAQQAQPDGGQVEVEVRRDAGGAAVVVRDHGPGIDPSVRARIFEPFFTTRREQGATGVGLAVALGLAHLQRGALEVESEPGRGATFTLRLPVSG